MGRIAAGSHNDEIIVHHVAAINAGTIGDKFVLADAIMHQKRVGIAAGTYRERLAGTDCDHMNSDAACRSEDRQNMPE